MNNHSPEEGERLHKYIARCGVSSRRAAEELIALGRVMVNDELVIEMGRKLGPDDRVAIDGQPIAAPRLHYVLMNKPKSVITSLDDPRGRATVMRFLPDLETIVKPVGRLDYDSEGLLLFTNDGELAARMTHPRHGVEKEYRATVQGTVTDEAAEKLRRGVFVEGRRTSPAKVKIVYRDKAGRNSVVDLILHEGRNRQIRRMFESVGYTVTELKRTRIGPLVLHHLRPGQCRILGKTEVADLRRLVGLH